VNVYACMCMHVCVYACVCERSVLLHRTEPCRQESMYSYRKIRDAAAQRGNIVLNRQLISNFNSDADSPSCPAKRSRSASPYTRNVQLRGSMSVSSSEADDDDANALVPVPRKIVRERSRPNPGPKVWSCVDSDDDMPPPDDNSPELSDDDEDDPDESPGLNEESSDDDDDDAADAHDEDSCSHHSDHSEQSEEDKDEQPYNTPVRGVAGAGYVPRHQKMRSSRASPAAEAFDNMSNDTWEVTQHGRVGSTPYATIKEHASGNTFAVHYTRIPKAMLHLTNDDCMEPMKTQACECHRMCYKTYQTTDEIRALRTELYTTCNSEVEVQGLLINKMKSKGSKYTLNVGTKSKKVCRRYYAKAHGVSVGSIKKAKKVASMKGMAPKERMASAGRESPKYANAFAFWHIFFEQNCQRPNDEIRLFPVAKPYKLIYTEYFEPWFERNSRDGQYQAAFKPGFATWKLARFADDFKDVKNRAKHTHARCAECARLKELLLASFVSGAAELEYKQQRRMHDLEVHEWRKLEAVVKAMGVSSPEEELIVMHDGTSSLGLPRLSGRSIKNISPERFEVTPWLAMDYSAGLKDYLYTPTATTPKDANTLISQLHVIIRRAKSDYNHSRHKARKLTIVADSASENKNNVLFAYCTDMVDNGWFDEIILLFGPVGHTHNGVDATHKVHNQNVAGCVSGDLGHFAQNYVKGFTGENSEGRQRPNASIVARTLDWNSYYRPVLRSISGFTKTKHDKTMVRGFRIAKQADGTTDVTWKVDPALEQEWRGAGGYPKTPGFYMLKCAPEGVPAYVKTPEVSAAQMDKYKKGIKGANMRATLAPLGLSACVDWNFEAGTTGVIPVHRYLEDVAPAPEWGRLCEVGAVEGKRGNLRLIKDYWDTSLPDTHTSLWTLPTCPRGSHLNATTNHFHYSGDAALLEHRILPRMRYRDEKARDCEVANHAQNGNGGGWVPDEPEDVSENKNSGDEREQKINIPAPMIERFEEDFKECKVGTYCVGLAHAKTGPTPYIFMGRITEVNTPNKTMTMKPYTCTKSSWKPACLDSKWHQHAKTTPQLQPHYAIMAYFPKMNKSKLLPGSVREKVRDRTIVWAK
jgi:hypothetical protein